MLLLKPVRGSAQTYVCKFGRGKRVIFRHAQRFTIPLLSPFPTQIAMSYQPSNQPNILPFTNFHLTNNQTHPEPITLSFAAAPSLSLTNNLGIRRLKLKLETAFYQATMVAQKFFNAITRCERKNTR